MHTTMDGSPPSCSSTTAAVTPSGPCVSPPTSTTDQQREAQGSPKQDTVCVKRPSTSKLKHCNRHMPYPDGTARSPGSYSSDGDSIHSDGEDAMRTTSQSKVKRIAANSRERKRMHTVNSAFDQLRELVPTYPSNRKLSKIDTLRLACTYIQDLVSLLHNTTAIQGEDVLYHQPPFPDGFSGYPVTVKQEMDFQPYPTQEHFRMQHASCLRFASDCPESFTNSTSESDSCTQSPPQQQQQPFMQCLPPPPPPPPSSSIAVRPPPLTRTSSEGVTASIHTRMAEASISTSVSNGGVVTGGGATSVGSLPPPLPTAAPAVVTNPQPSAASPSPIPSPPMYQRTQGNITSPLAMHSVQHSSVPTPHLIHASLSHHTTTPVWNRPSSIPTPYPVYGQ